MRITACIAGLVLALSSYSALAAAQLRDGIDDTPSAGAMAFDLLIVRPVGLVATVAGIGLFILDLPLSIVQGEPPSAPANRFIVEPARFTFQRPLGDMGK